MSVWLISARTSITVDDYRSLLASWRSFDDLARSLIGSYHVTRPLTASQLRRLPKELRARLA
jgi:hypothetical protein